MYPISCDAAVTTAVERNECIGKMQDRNSSALQVRAPQSVRPKAPNMRNEPVPLQEPGRLDQLPFRASDPQLAHHEQDRHRTRQRKGHRFGQTDMQFYTAVGVRALPGS